MDPNAPALFLNPSIFHTICGRPNENDDGLIDLGLSLGNLHPNDSFQSSRHLVESKECWGYVKVNMDGVIVGRKICVLEHASYSSLALQLEDMFGRQSGSGLRLFHAGSDFSLFYEDWEANWRNVCDVPWKEFVDCVKRLRIVHKN